MKRYNMEDIKDIKRFYEDNADFAEYVAAFARSKKLSIDEALQQAIVRERAIDLINRL